MIILSVIFALVGLFLLYAEFYLPGGIVGGIGGLLMIAGFVLFTSDNPGPLWITTFILGEILLTFLVIKLALWRIKASKSKNTFYSNQDQEGFRASIYDKTLIGKKGISLSSLTPAGHIQIDGKHYQAVSQSRFIEKGVSIEVVRGEGARLIVKSIK